MNHRTFYNHYCLGVALLLFTFGAQPANAANLPISGTYEVIQKTDLGSQSKVVMRFHLTNRGQAPLLLQALSLSDFGHRPGRAPLATSITLPPGSSEAISQSFVIPRLQFDQWKMGASPRVVLELQTTIGTRITQAVRLERVPAGKGE
jgi:hypothetical protein